MLGTALGLAVGLAATCKGDELSDAADEAGVSALDLLGAVNTTGLAPRAYLLAVGELAIPGAPGQGASTAGGGPPSAAGSGRVACIENKESGGANVANIHGSGAVGVLQYMPGTFYAHAAEMGHFDWSPWVPWQARAVAAHDLAMGRRSQWTVGGC